MDVCRRGGLYQRAMDDRNEVRLNRPQPFLTFRYLGADEPRMRSEMTQHEPVARDLKRPASEWAGQCQKPTFRRSHNRRLRRAMVK
jgi:hypothetical protein